MTAQAQAPLLTLVNLRVAFGAQEVVHGIDLRIRAGDRVALVGESGSGKAKICYRHRPPTCSAFGATTSP